MSFLITINDFQVTVGVTLQIPNGLSSDSISVHYIKANNTPLLISGTIST